MFRSKGRSKTTGDEQSTLKKDKNLVNQLLERSSSDPAHIKKTENKSDKIDSAVASWMGKDKLKNIQEKSFFKILNKKKPLTSDTMQPEDFDIHVPLRYPAMRFLIDHLEKLRAEEAVGIFRVTGNLLTIKEIVGGLENEPYPLHDQDLLDQSGVNEFAGALKYYLREAPIPLIPYSHLHKFAEALRISELQSLKLFALSEAVESLADENKLMLRDLTFFLRRILANSEQNKMDLNNLAVSFGPKVLRYETSNPELCDIHSMSLSCEIVTFLLLNATDLFNDQKFEKSQPIVDESPSSLLVKGPRRARNIMTPQDSPLINHTVFLSGLAKDTTDANMETSPTHIEPLANPDSTADFVQIANHNFIPSIPVFKTAKVTAPTIPPRPPFLALNHGQNLCQDRCITQEKTSILDTGNISEI
eukprot:TRINITY_DN8346_c0_g1_i1.p1 TRINITY_DN8346_c0_g1~~TRINITY_DN8346_c0_g1_i1.p1  ORF type:complete len:418 (+),score=61.73 TRINITY_DN8346_c0_g1_i1:90-1343(+)